MGASAGADGAGTGFVLAAGRGSRMGAVGRVLPKPLWPVFGKALLELQVLRLRGLGVREVYANVHHLAREMEDFVRERGLPVTLLREERLLGAGGAFHNLRRAVGDRRVLATACDQFYFAPGLADWASLEGPTLFGVEAGEGHNRLVVEDGLLAGVAPPAEGGPPVTFSGMSVVDLARLPDREGPGGFFSHVADPGAGPVRVRVEPGAVWRDLGSLDRWAGVLGEAAAAAAAPGGGPARPFVDFLVGSGALDPALAGPGGYGWDGPGEGFLLGGGLRLSGGRVSYRGVTDRVPGT